MEKEQIRTDKNRTEQNKQNRTELNKFGNGWINLAIAWNGWK